MSDERLRTALQRARREATRLLEEPPHGFDSEEVRKLAFTLLEAWATDRVDVYAEVDAAYPLKSEEERETFIDESAGMSVTYTADALAFLVGSDRWLEVDEDFKANVLDAEDLPTVVTRAAFLAMRAELERVVPQVDEGVDS